MKLRTVPVILTTLAALSWAAPAYAVSYGSRTAPIKASDNSDNGNAWFYGNITIDDQTSMRNGYYYKDSGADGNSVYVQTNWYYRSISAEGQVSYDYSGKDQSARIGTAEGWVHGADYDALIKESDRGRGVAKVCEDQSWSPDPCSKTATVTLSY